MTTKALGKKPPKCYCLCCAGSVKGDGSIECNKLLAAYKVLLEAAEELEGMCSCYDTHHKTCICGSERLAKKLRISAGCEK